MNMDTFRTIARCAALSLALVLSQGLLPQTHAADGVPVGESIKQINNDLRQIERDMFGGKTEEAIAALEPLTKKLLQVKETDPNNAQVKSAETRFAKLVRDLERRTGKDLGGGTLTAASTSSDAKLPAKPGVKPPSVPGTKPASQQTQPAAPLPFGARRPAQNAERDLSSVDSAIGRVGDPKWNQDQLLGNMDRSLESARNNLKSAREEAAKQKVTEHPTFDALEAGIAEAVTKIAAARQRHEAAQQEASGQAAAVTADVQALKALYDRVQPVFARASGVVIHYNDVQVAQELIETIESFEKEQLDHVERQMRSFGEQYGTTRDAIDQKANAMGFSDPYYRASFAYTQLAEGIENVKKTRVVMAADLIRRGEEMKTRTAKNIHDFARLRQHGEIESHGRLAARFDPENVQVIEFNQGIAAWIVADAKALNDKIDKAVFPKQAADAPANTASLVKTAIEFLQKENDKLAAERGGEVSKVLAVRVTGPWRVFKKNLLGEPIQYNLPVATAVQTETEKGQNLARVYLSTILTRELRGVDQGPPFTGVTVGDSYYIRPSAIQ